jgi:hypothetical protein
VSPVKYELVFYIPEDGILLSRRRENLKSYTGVSLLAFDLGENALISDQYKDNMTVASSPHVGKKCIANFTFRSSVKSTGSIYMFSSS